MSLWVRSQDKKHLVEIHEASVGGQNNNVIVCDKLGVLGRYESEERALEVLNEIENAVCNDMKFYIMPQG